MPDGASRRPRLGILSYSTGEFDGRSDRVARSAIAAGYDVTLYARWAPGLPVEEARDGYRLVRAPGDWRLAVPGLRGRARARWARAKAGALPADGAVRAPGSAVVARGAVPGPTAPAAGSGGSPTGSPGGAGASAGAAGAGGRAGGRTGGRLARVPLVGPVLARWVSTLLMFPLRPLGWAAGLPLVAEPADLWHGMWAGSLPAMLAVQRRFGGATVYDSRDVLLLSREYARLERPWRPLLARLERRWAHRVDRVVTVNEPCADLVARQLRVPRPVIVMNNPERWTPPEPRPDRIRAALGLDPATRVVLYQGQLNTDRGIEQALEAVLRVPDAVLVLLGYGPAEARYTALTAAAPYAGHAYRLPAVPPSELLAWTASADVLVMAIQPTSLNHRFATPQKLWEALAAGVPVVASDLPAMAGVVNETGAGVVCDPTSPEAIAAGLRAVLDAPAAEHEAMRTRALAAAHDRYNWEAQATVLLGLYGELLGRGAAVG